MVSKRLQPTSRPQRQRTTPFDRIDPCAQFSKNGRLVSGPCSDLQHTLILFQIERFHYERDHKRLGDRLLLANRQGIIAVSAPPEGFFHKQMSTDRSHGPQDSGMRNPTSYQLLGHHSLPGNDIIHYRIVNLFFTSIDGFFAP
jgi:hypothetical protein